MRQLLICLAICLATVMTTECEIPAEPEIWLMFAELDKGLRSFNESFMFSSEKLYETYKSMWNCPADAFISLFNHYNELDNRREYRWCDECRKSRCGYRHYLALDFKDNDWLDRFNRHFGRTLPSLGNAERPLDQNECSLLRD